MIRLRNGRSHGRQVGPVLRPLGPLRDPAANQIELRRRDPLTGLRRRHPFVGIVGGHPSQGFAFFRLEGDKGSLAAKFGEQTGLRIQPQIGLPLLVVRPVAIEAVLRQDRANVPAKDDLVVRENRSRPEPDDRRGGAQKNDRRAESAERVHATGTCAGKPIQKIASNGRECVRRVLVASRARVKRAGEGGWGGSLQYKRISGPSRGFAARQRQARPTLRRGHRSTEAVQLTQFIRDRRNKKRLRRALASAVEACRSRRQRRQQPVFNARFPNELYGLARDFNADALQRGRETVGALGSISRMAPVKPRAQTRE